MTSLGIRYEYKNISPCCQHTEVSKGLGVLPACASAWALRGQSVLNNYPSPSLLCTNVGLLIIEKQKVSFNEICTSNLQCKFWEKILKLLHDTDFTRVCPTEACVSLWMVKVSSYCLLLIYCIISFMKVCYVYNHQDFPLHFHGGASLAVE